MLSATSGYAVDPTGQHYLEPSDQYLQKGITCLHPAGHTRNVEVAIDQSGNRGNSDTIVISTLEVKVKFI